MKSICVFGIFVADLCFFGNTIPIRGQTILGTKHLLGPGGKGSNQAVAAGRLGADVTIISRLGRDDFGKMAKKTWQDAGVNLAITYDPDAYTGAAFVFVNSESGDNAIIIAPGVASDITPQIIDDNSALISNADVFMTQLEQPFDAAWAGLKLAKENGGITILNPAPAAPLPDDIFTLCDYITPNETEAEALTGLPVRTEAEAEHAAKALAQKGVTTPVITLGEQGAYLYKHGLVPAFDAGSVVETTGAGDAFNGALAIALAEGQPAHTAVLFGCATAALSVTRPGAASSMPTRSEVDTLLSE